MIRRVSACYRNTYFNRIFNRQDYWSTGVGSPPRDAKQNLMQTEATESGGYTSVAFERYAMTGDDSNDVQFGVRKHRNSGSSVSSFFCLVECSRALKF